MIKQIKGDIDTLDRTKDEEAKKFLSHNIHFDFNILVQIKETMVDISSGCMELALKVITARNIILTFSFVRIFLTETVSDRKQIYRKREAKSLCPLTRNRV